MSGSPIKKQRSRSSSINSDHGTGSDVYFRAGLRSPEAPIKKSKLKVTSKSTKSPKTRSTLKSIEKEKEKKSSSSSGESLSELKRQLSEALSQNQNLTKKLNQVNKRLVELTEEFDYETNFKKLVESSSRDARIYREKIRNLELELYKTQLQSKTKSESDSNEIKRLEFELEKRIVNEGKDRAKNLSNLILQAVEIEKLAVSSSREQRERLKIKDLYTQAHSRMHVTVDSLTSLEKKIKSLHLATK